MNSDPEDGLLLKSRVDFTRPPENTNMARELLEAFKRHSARVLLVDTRSGREWTGAKLLDHCGRIATGLVRRVGLQINQVVMTICDRNDSEISVALGLVLSGAAIYATTPTDGYKEAEVLCELVRPQVLVISSAYHDRAIKLRQNVAGMQETKIVWIDRPQVAAAAAQSNGFSHTNGHSNPTETTKTLVDENNNEPEAEASHRDSIESTIKRDGVLLIEQLELEPYDTKLIDSIANELIEPEEHILTYMLTSGSTGRPKVVPSTHAELVWGLFSMISAAKNPFSRGDLQKQPLDANKCDGVQQAGGSYLLPLSKDDVVAGDLPLDHGAGLNTMFLALWLGAKFIVMPSYDADVFWQSVNDFKVSFSISSTTFCYKLFSRLKGLVEENETNEWDLSSFKYITCCGAKLAFIELVNEVLKHYPHIRVTQAYGCTENGFISIVHKDETPEFLNSTGYIFPGLVVKVVDPNNNERALERNKRGELMIWSRSLFKGYRCHRDDDATKVFADCHDDQGVFYKTGDQAHFDEAAHLYIHGRFKDTLVLMEDWKILPAELEEVVNEHPLVEQSVVVGVPDPNLPGCHAPKVFVKLYQAADAQLSQLTDGGELVARLNSNDLDFIAGHIYDFVASRTARPKHLTGGVRILDEFPRVGLLNKVDRKALRAMD